VRRLLAAELRRSLIEARRYPMETIASVVVLILVFLGLLLGATYLSGTVPHGGRLSVVVVGYVVWSLSLYALSEMGYSIQNEAQNGTLEQLFLSPWSAGMLMLARAVVGMVLYLAPLLVILAALLAVTRVSLTLSPLDALPAALAVVTAWGLGLVVATAAMLFRRMGQLLNLFQFVLLFVIMAPVGQLPGAWHLVAVAAPLTAAVGLLDHLMVAHMNAVGTGALVAESLANAALYLGGGLWLFSRADRLARARGILGHY
jgi:ABC-2 type transport system permease protein